MNTVQNKPVLAVTLGDAAGIGPELVAKAVAIGFLEQSAIPIIIGDRSVFEAGQKAAGVTVSCPVVSTIEEALSVKGLAFLDTKSIDMSTDALGKVDAAVGKEEGDVLVSCIDYCKAGLIDGFCFAPLNKAAMKLGGYHYDSEHEMFADYFGVTSHFGEMNVLDGLWNIRVTSHIPLNEVCSKITVERILETVQLGYETLRRYGVEHPRFAVSAVNPHGGESGTCGREEIDLIAPAIETAKAQGIDLSGPYPSDTLFLKAFGGGYDGVITMYHDQGQIAIKLKGFSQCVTVSAGLPAAVTTPAHGTAFDIVGKGVCSTSAFERAWNICAKMAENDRKRKYIAAAGAD